MKLVLLKIAMSGLCLLLTGCAKNAAFQAVPFPDQARTIDDPEKCRIYVMRDTTGAPVTKMDVFDGDMFLGFMEVGTYLCWEREAGKLFLTAKPDSPLPAPMATLKFSADFGKGTTYYIRLAIRPPTLLGLLKGGNRFEIVEHERGRKILAKCYPPVHKRPAK